ncbi:MAG: AIR synthase [Elusimicrobia bacterium]|nr:AIR synthase [Elusimicrobiota bacterium]
MKTEELPKVGKISSGIFDQVIYPRLGARRRDVLVGPRHGVDCGIVDLGHGQVMAITADPFFIVPDYGWERAAWFAFHILASDVATSGLAPAYLSVDLNLPLSIRREELETMWAVIHRECVKYGVSVVTGHTAKYEGCHYPMVGGATMIAVGPKDRYVTTQMARPGDKIIVTKGAAIEAAGLFAAAFPDLIEAKHGAAFAREARKLFWQMSVVDDARIAAGVGVREKGVTSMHDATECGVWGGLYEIAKASDVGMRIRKGDIIVSDVVDKICSQFDMDPYSSISEGTLLVTCRDHAAGKILGALRKADITATVAGDVVTPRLGVRVIDAGKERVLEHPKIDPFWAAFGRWRGRRRR